MQLSDCETLLQRYGGLIANKKGMFIKSSLLPSSRDKIKEAFFNATAYVLQQKDVNWEIINAHIICYPCLSYFIDDNLVEKYNQIQEKLRGDKNFWIDNSELGLEYYKFLGEVMDKSKILSDEILNYIGAFEQGKKFKEDFLRKTEEAFKRLQQDVGNSGDAIHNLEQK